MLIMSQFFDTDSLPMVHFTSQYNNIISLDCIRIVFSYVYGYCDMCKEQRPDTRELIMYKDQNLCSLCAFNKVLCNDMNLLTSVGLHSFGLNIPESFFLPLVKDASASIFVKNARCNSHMLGFVKSYYMAYSDKTRFEIMYNHVLERLPFRSLPSFLVEKCLSVVFRHKF